MGSAVSIDGALVEPGAASIPVLDRGFLYGDSAFEVTRTYGGQPFALGLHLQRLRHSCAQLEIPIDVDDATLRREVREVLDAADNEEAYVRVVGVVGNKAATVSGLRPGSFRRGPIQVRQLLGSSVFIEFDQNLHHARLSLYSRKTFEGRLVDFGPQSELSSVRDYFRRRFAMDVGDDARLLIIDEAPGEMWRYPLYFGLGLLLALSSLMFFLWSLRTRVVDEDAILK